MSQFGSNYSRGPVVPHGRDPCPCGSQLRFKRCCKEQLDQLPHKPEPLKYIDDDPRTALRLARAEFSRYAIWHRTNTLPWYRDDPSAANEMREVDARALAVLLRNLRLCHVASGTALQFEAVLDQNAALIDSALWRGTVLKERLIHYRSFDENSPDARRLAASLDLLAIEDPDVIAIALPLRTDLSAGARVRITGRVCDLTDDWELYVHFRIYQGILWELLGDREEAASAYSDAVKRLPEDPQPQWAHTSVIGALAFAGRARNSVEMQHRAIALATSFLEQASDKEEEAAIRHARAAAFRHMSDDALAEEDQRWLVDHRGTTDDRIQLAQTLIAREQYVEARQLLESLDPSELTPGEYYDFAFTLFGLLYGPDSEDLHATVKQHLEAVKPEFPAWREFRADLLLALAENKASAPRKGTWAAIRDYLVLQPNMFGLGIDLRPLIDQLVESSRRKK